MKSLLKLGMALLIAAMLFGITGCFEPDDDGTDPEETSGVSFTDFAKKNNAAIFVKNDTDERLVAFKGDFNKESILGGIPARASYHGLEKKTSIFKPDTSIDFPMVLVKESVYKSKPLRDLSNDDIFTRVYVLYNSQGDNTQAFAISGKLGGTRRIQLIGHPKYHVEWRVDGPNGPTLGYAPMGAAQINIMVDPDEYYLVPVFKYYNAVRNNLVSLFPKGKGGNSWLEIISAGTSTISLNPADAANYLNDNRTLGAAWVAVTNSSSIGITLVRGNELYTDQQGFSVIGSNSNRTIQIDMPRAGNSFGTSITQGSYRITAGPLGYAEVETEDGEKTFTLNTDTLYTISVTGNWNTGSPEPKAVINIKKVENVEEGGVSVDFDDLIEAN